MSKNYNEAEKAKYFITTNQIDLSIISIPLKTKYGTIRPIKVKEYPNLLIELEILKLQDWEIKKIIKKTIKGLPLESFLIEQLENKTALKCIQENMLSNKKLGIEGLLDKYNNLFRKLVIDFEDNFMMKFANQTEFDEFRKLILDYNRIGYIDWNPNPRLRHFQKLDIFAKKTINKDIDFDAIYTTLMCAGHSPHNINDYSLAQFYSAFSRYQYIKSYDTSTLFKTVDNKYEITEWFKSTLSKNSVQDRDWEDIQKENSNFTKTK